MTQEQRAKAKARNGRYLKTTKGRSLALRLAYKRIDDCDLTSQEICELISQPCVYCGTLDENRGLDRIDNSKPHIRGNVQPACTSCNLMRGDRFSVDEMHMIGAVVHEIRKRRRVESLIGRQPVTFFDGPHFELV